MTLPTRSPEGMPDRGIGHDRPDELVLNDGLSSSTFDARDLVALAYRQRWGMAVIFGISMLIGIALILLLPKIYQARASVQIDQQSTKVLGTEDLDPAVSASDSERFLQTQVDILNSRGLARLVANKLALAADDTFLHKMAINPPMLSTPEERMPVVLDALQHHLLVDSPHTTRVIGIQFSSRNAPLAAEIANTYATVLIENNIDRKYSTSDYSRNFLRNQMEQAKSDLEKSERALIAYARSAKLVDASAGVRGPTGTEAPTSLLTGNLVDLNASLSAATTARIAAAEHWREVNSQPLMTGSDVLANPTIEALLQQHAQLTATLFQLRQHLKPDHPTVLQAKAQLDELDAQTKGLAESIKQSVYGQYVVAQKQEQAISDQMDALTTKTLAEQDRQVQYNILKREVDSNREMFEALLQRYEQVNAESGVSANNITTVDTAEVPRSPSSPKSLLILAITLVGGIGLAVVYAFLRDHFDDAIRNPIDVEQRLGLPLLGVVPANKDGQPFEQIGMPKSAISEAYNSIRTSIELSSTKGLFTSILVTSSSKGEGKSTSSYAIARQFALLGKRVLLIDGDMRRPSLHRFFGLTLADKGLSTVLAGLHSAAEVILPTGFERLSVMPSGPLPPDPVTLLASDALGPIMDSLAVDYDLIVIDGPPVLALADAVELSTSAKATVFVIEAGETQLGHTRSSISRILRASGNVIGVVVTKYDSDDARYSYYSTYYNYRYET